MTLCDLILTALHNSRKDGMSVHELVQTVNKRDYEVLECLIHMEGRGLVKSAVVDDNSILPRRIFHLSRAMRTAMTTKRPNA